ncbi:MAG: TIGR04282 family arsenosugar biosynthesis glycosyltransferase [Stackebrandtia sp.]
MPRPHLLVLAKSPAPGLVKTRLCPPFSPAEAAEIAEAALADTLQAVADCRAQRRILALDGPPGPWLPPGFEVVPQVRGSFNDRLAAAWDYAGGPGLQIGMDTPQVTAELLDDSLAAVLDGDADAALGLAEDGGWWALAMAQSHPHVFRGVPMSHADTGRRQHARLCSLSLKVAELPTLRDLDDVADARAIAALAPGTRTARTVRSLAPKLEEAT